MVCNTVLSSIPLPTLPSHFLVLSCCSPVSLYLPGCTFATSTDNTPLQCCVYPICDNEQLHRQTATLPLKKSRFSIHKVLESRLTSATVFSWLLLSPALLICSREKPGHRHGRSQAAELGSPPPPLPVQPTLQVPKGWRQINKRDASAAIRALAPRKLLPLNAVSSD